MQAPDPREALLRRRLAAPLLGKPGSEHPDPELIAAHAALELSPEYGLALTRHLAVCDDGRCTAVLRDAIAGAAVARDDLYGRLGTPPSDAPPPEPEPAVTMGADDRTLPPPPALGSRERVFECSDELWEAVAAFAQQDGRTVDALLDEAMEVFARQRAGQEPADPPTAGLSPPVGAPGIMMLREVTLREAPFTTGSPVGAPSQPPRERNTPTLPRAYLPSPAAAAARRISPPPSPYAEHLSVILEGVRYEVTKERFVVGRGGRASDIAIDDPGVSRQHAVIERAGGAYYLVDMGSTNGVEYQGERIARKEIAHGDRFRIADHELEFRFT
jgi:hypothetical protein